MSSAARGLAVGSVLTDARGQIVAEGRDRVYDAPGGADALQGTPLAHAEMNVLAAVPTELDIGDHVLWSTQRPCPMCTVALSCTGVGRVRFMAEDPAFDGVGAPPGGPVTRPAALTSVDGPGGLARTDESGGRVRAGGPDGRARPGEPCVPVPDDGSHGPVWEGPSPSPWVVTANLLFLHNIARARGTAASVIARNRWTEPETVELTLDVVTEGVMIDAFAAGRPLTATLAELWDRIVEAAVSRDARRGASA
ncbi:hypothetical protein GCM10010517_55410 [Streptosporangium fragile]|uniref:CMP/dCMP-type deaminase domain-containing protein n=2 Tax=Streptosporangium fragile TaxID=46186 RepID=A0ABP6IJQ2_9ACTN